MTLASRRRAGFTLVEILVVIAILGSVAAISVPAFRDSVKPDGLRDGTAQVVRVLERARMTARTAGHPVTVTFDAAAGRFWVDEPALTGRIDLASDATLWSSQPRPRVRFEPAGPAAADDIGVRVDGRASRVSVDALTGEITGDAR